MYIENEYKKVVEIDEVGTEHCFLIFTDGQGVLRKVETDIDVCEQVISLQKEEMNGHRKERYHCVSLEEFDYEGEAFATEDRFLTTFGAGDSDLGDKIKRTLSMMKASQADVIESLVIRNENQVDYAQRHQISQVAVSYRLAVARKNFMKCFKKLKD